MRYFRSSLILLLLASAAANAGSNAATTPLNVKPGLWETTRQEEGGGAPPIPPAVLATMPPEVREKVATGFQPGAANNPFSVEDEVERGCLAQGDFNQLLMPEFDKSCKVRVIKSTGSIYEAEAQCTQEFGGIQNSMSIRFEASSPERVAGTTTVKIASTSPGDGSVMTITNRIKSRWLGANCGKVKP